jgi:hypothetical protein
LSWPDPACVARETLLVMALLDRATQSASIRETNEFYARLGGPLLRAMTVFGSWRVMKDMQARNAAKRNQPTNLKLERLPQAHREQ